MRDNKTNELKMIKAVHWPQNKMSVLLIIAAMIIGCCYMVSSIMQVMDI